MTPSVIYGDNQCQNPIYLKSERMFVNCGKCDYCRKLWVNDWATRLQMQKELSQFTICMTLTYNSENLPKHNGVPTLSKDDVQKFFKRVRKTLSKDYKDVYIQYFISGEYGSSYLRPHYHLVLFVNTDNTNYTKYDFQTICLEKWQKGYIQFMEGNGLSIRYLAKYIGKTTGISEYADDNGIPKPFILCSRNPAIAAKYLEQGDNFERHFRNLNDSHVHLFGMSQYLLPRYIRKKCTQHIPKHLKQKFYYDLEQKKLNDYEKWLANCRVRFKHRANDFQCSYNSISPNEYERREREKANRLKALQDADLNYIQLIKNQIKQ